MVQEVSWNDRVRRRRTHQDLPAPWSGAGRARDSVRPRCLAERLHQANGRHLAQVANQGSERQPLQQGIPHLDLVEPLSWNRLTRQSAVVDHKWINEIVVFSPSPPAPPGGSEGKRDDLQCSI